MAELVDALASGASVRKDVEVRVLFWAPLIYQTPYLYTIIYDFWDDFVPNFPKTSYQIDCSATYHFKH